MFAKRLLDLAILLSAHIALAPVILASLGKTFAMGWDRKQGERKVKRA